MGFVGKCLYLEIEGEKVLVVGDLHLGYEGSMRASGVLVPEGRFDDFISEFDEIFERVGEIDRVVLLGDLKHEFGKILREEWKEVLDFIDYLKGKGCEVIIIKGNHDVIIESVVKRKEVEVVDYLVWGKYCFVHGDKKFKEMKDSKVWVMGHGHPAVNLSDGTKVEKYKCFLVGKYKEREVIILPSFFDINEGSDPREYSLGMAWDFDLDSFEVKIVKEDSLEVLDFGKLGKL